MGLKDKLQHANDKLSEQMQREMLDPLKEKDHESSDVGSFIPVNDIINNPLSIPVAIAASAIMEIKPVKKGLNKIWDSFLNLVIREKKS